jgi:hypothetical protein
MRGGQFAPHPSLFAIRIQWLAAFPVHMPDRATAAGGWTAGPPDSTCMGPSGHHPGGHTAGYRSTEQRARRVETIPGAVHIFWREHLDEKEAFQPASGRRRPPGPRTLPSDLPPGNGGVVAAIARHPGRAGAAESGHVMAHKPACANVSAPHGIIGDGRIRPAATESIEGGEAGRNDGPTLA